MSYLNAKIARCRSALPLCRGSSFWLFLSKIYIFGVKTKIWRSYLRVGMWTDGYTEGALSSQSQTVAVSTLQQQPHQSIWCLLLHFPLTPEPEPKLLEFLHLRQESSSNLKMAFTLFFVGNLCPIFL